MLEAAGAHNEEAVQEAEEALALKARAAPAKHLLWSGLQRTCPCRV